MHLLFGPHFPHPCCSPFDHFAPAKMDFLPYDEFPSLVSAFRWPHTRMLRELDTPTIHAFRVEICFEGVSGRVLVVLIVNG